MRKKIQQKAKLKNKIPNQKAIKESMKDIESILVKIVVVRPNM